jgi:hypothetical protein
MVTIATGLCSASAVSRVKEVPCVACELVPIPHHVMAAVVVIAWGLVTKTRTVMLTSFVQVSCDASVKKHAD